MGKSEIKKPKKEFLCAAGSGEAETLFYSGVSFVKDDTSYHIFSQDDIGSEELFSIAGDILTR